MIKDKWHCVYCSHIKGEVWSACLDGSGNHFYVAPIRRGVVGEKYDGVSIGKLNYPDENTRRL